MRSVKEINLTRFELFSTCVVENAVNVHVQEAAINVFSTIKKYLDDDTMTKLLLPKAKSLFTKSSAVRVRSVYRQLWKCYCLFNS